MSRRKYATLYTSAKLLFKVCTSISANFEQEFCGRIDASLTQNQCLQCVTPPLTHVEVPRLRDTTELNNDGMIKLVDVHYQTEPNLSIFTATNFLARY